MAQFSKSSADKLATVHQDLQFLFNEVIKNFDCTIIYGVRTLEEQQRLYTQGRSVPGNIVTNCDGVDKMSKHQSGRAVDVVPYPIDWANHERFKQFGWFVKGVAGTLKRYGAIENDIIWGGLWRRFVDYPHYEI